MKVVIKMKKNRTNIIIILIFSLIFVLLTKNYYIGDDTIFHTSNIISYTTNLITPKLLNNLGYGINIFYPPLPHFIGSSIYHLTNNITITIKILEWLSFFLAGLAMYHYTNTIFNKKETSLITSLLYISMPYLFTDTITRGALNESFIFFILPIIFLSFNYLEKNKERNFYIYFIMGFTLSIYTHLVLTIYITIISVIYLLLSYKKIITKINLKRLFTGTIIVLCITSNYWIPLLEHYYLKDYVIFLTQYTKEKSVITLPLYYYFFPKIYLSGAMNILRFNINPLSLIFLALTYIIIYKQKIKEEHKKQILIFIVITIIVLIPESTNIIWNIIPNILKNIQFAWRLSLINAFTISIIAGYGINIFKNKKIIIPIVILILGIMNIHTTITTKQNINRNNPLNTTCCSYIWQQEYLPKNAKENIYYLTKRDETIITDNTNITPKKDKNMNLKFKIDSVPTEIELPRIYYLGYELKINNKKIKIYQNKRGLISAKIKEKGTYQLKYKGTILTKISNFISLFGIIVGIKYITKKEYIAK